MCNFQLRNFTQVVLKSLILVYWCACPDLSRSSHHTEVFDNKNPLYLINELEDEDFVGPYRGTCLTFKRHNVNPGDDA